MADGVAVLAVGFPHLLLHFAVLLYQGRVQTVRRWCVVHFVLLLLLLVKSFGFGLCHTIVEVHGRCQQQILAVGLIHTFGHYLLVEDYREEFVAHLVDGFARFQWQLACFNLMQCLAQILGRESWLELFATIVVVNTT